MKTKQELIDDGRNWVPAVVVGRARCTREYRLGNEMLIKVPCTDPDCSRHTTSVIDLDTTSIITLDD